MLTNEHAIVSYSGSRAFPDRLRRAKDARYLEHARRMLEVYRTGAGRTRRDLHRDVANILAPEPECPSRRIHAFCKLLDDESEFETDPRGEAADLRLRVFALAAPFHPLVRARDRLFEIDETEAKARIAREIGRPWDEIEGRLYSDVMAFQRLASFRGYPDPESLLSRYNVAQLQACLYRAERATILAAGDFKTILRYAKLARLMIEIVRVAPDRYRIGLSGPASVLRETHRYGVDMARFLPALLACRDWSLDAILRTPWGGRARLSIAAADGYRSHLPAPEEFDSTVEEAFAKKFGETRDGWRLIREGAILHEDQHTFVPDFVFRHESGAEAYLEIVGFWTPEYLAQKRETVRRFARHTRILLAVPERSLREDVPVGDDILTYKTKLKLQTVMAKLAGLVGVPGGGPGPGDGRAADGAIH